MTKKLYTTPTLTKIGTVAGVGSHVRVNDKMSEYKPAIERMTRGVNTVIVQTEKPHPHAGKTGVIKELLGVVTSWGRPRAMIVIDAGCENAGNIMIVGLINLTVIE